MEVVYVEKQTYMHIQVKLYAGLVFDIWKASKYTN